MAFEHNSEKSKNIKEALKKDTNSRNDSDTNNITQELSQKAKSILKNKKPKENKKSYNIMLDPSVKAKADKMAKSTNYPSTSSFLNDLIKNL